MNPNFWNDRYAATEFVYGTEPNDFLVSVADRLPRGRVLMLADGEGRNGVAGGGGVGLVAWASLPMIDGHDSFSPEP